MGSTKTIANTMLSVAILFAFYATGCLSKSLYG